MMKSSRRTVSMPGLLNRTVGMGVEWDKARGEAETCPRRLMVQRRIWRL